MSLLTHRVTGRGEPLLLLNGALMSIAAWQPVVPALEPLFQVVRCDFRGQLFSPGEAPPDFGAHVADVLAVLDHLGLARVHMAGVSFGSLVALRLAAQIPERIASLAAITSTERIKDETWRDLEELRNACREAAAGGDPRRVFDLTLPMYSAGYRSREGESLAMQRDWIKALPEIWFRGIAALLAAVEGLDMRPDLPCIQCPALVVAAEEDTTFPLEHSRALAGAISGARLVVVPGVGHGMVIEKPLRLGEILASFFGSLRRPPA